MNNQNRIVSIRVQPLTSKTNSEWKGLLDVTAILGGVEVKNLQYSVVESGGQFRATRRDTVNTDRTRKDGKPFTHQLAVADIRMIPVIDSVLNTCWKTAVAGLPDDSVSPTVRARRVPVNVEFQIDSDGVAINWLPLPGADQETAAE